MESVCFTGEYYEMTRAELTEKASKKFEVRKSVTKDLDILVCDDPNSGSSKLEKAKKNGTRVITYKEFMDMVDDIKDDGVFYIRNGVLKKCMDNKIENVVIPSGVTEIDFSAFYDCFHLKSIEIPEGVKEIGREFQGFSELESVIIHKGTQIIKYNAFEKNPLLKFVQLPSSLSEIQTEAFLRCPSLSKIVFEGTIEQWKKVKGLENLLQYAPATSVKCSDGEWQKPLVFVEDGVAVKCLDKSTTSIKLDEGVTAISENAFKECASVLSIELPSTLTEIRKGAFDDCKNVEKIVSHSPLFPFNEKTGKLYDATGKTKKVVLSILAGKEEAKKEKIAQVQNVSASSVLESIMSEHKTNAEVIRDDKNVYLQIQTTDGGIELLLADSKVSKWMANLPAFLDFVATGADSIAIRKFAMERGLEDSSKKFISISKDGVASWKKKMEPVYLFIPEGVKKIEDNAFHYCNYLEQVVFPDGLEEIGHSAFTDCKSLTKLVFPPSLKVIGNSAFYCCEYLEDFEIPNGVEKIEAGAFSTNSRFEFLRIPGSVKIIEHASFKECHKLKTLVIEKGVEKIEKEAFQDCEKLSEITYTGTVAEWEKIEKERKWHYNVPAQSVKCSDAEASIAVNREVIKTDTYKLAIYDNGVEECVCTGVTEKLVIPEGVTLIEYGAFYGVKGIKSVELPSSLTKIDEGALSHCENLKSVVFPPNITAIEKDAFRGCTEIESLEIPEGVTTIGIDAFKDCTALKSIKIPESVTVIHDAFGRCTALESIVIPEGVKIINAAAFEDCTALKSVVFPASLTGITNKVFNHCSSLCDITFKGTMEQWKAVSKYFWGNEDMIAKVVHCADGDVEIEEY